MLPDFKKTKAIIAERTSEFLETRISFYMGRLGSIGRRPLHEGTRFVTDYGKGVVDDSAVKPIHSMVEFDTAELLKGPEAAFEYLDKLAYDQAGKQTRLIFDKVSDVTEQIGNVIDVRGQVTPDHILEMIEKVEIGFTQRGEAIIPQPFGAPEVTEAFKRAYEQILNTPLLAERLTRILTEQKQKWYDRAANRQLVD